MFALKQGTIIAEGLRIVGTVKGESAVEIMGQVEGELHCGSLVVSHEAYIKGPVQANDVIVDGKVEGPIQGRTVILQSRAHVVGDIRHQSLAIENGAFFDGRSVRVQGNGQPL